MARKILNNGLVLNLDARETVSKNWLDLSGEQNKATLYNKPKYTEEDFGSYYFDGNDQYGRLPTDFIDTTKPITAFFVFRTVGKGVIFGQAAQFNYNESPGYVPALYVDSFGKLRYSFFWHAATDTKASEKAVNDGQIHVFAITTENGEQVAYLDGEQISITNYTQDQYSSNYFYTLGVGRCENWADFPQNNHFNGNIYDVLFYNRKLSKKELAQNYNALKR